jgi:hypothetical protein
MLNDRVLRLVDLVRLRVPADRNTCPLTVQGIQGLAARMGRPIRAAVARCDGIGDWILTFPLIAALNDSSAVASVTLVGPSNHRCLLESLTRMEFIGVELWANHDTPWPHGAVGKALAISALGQRRAYLAGQRLVGQFDLVVLPRWDTDRGQNMRFLAAGASTLIAGHDPVLQPQASPKERDEGEVLTIRCRDERLYAHESERLELLGLTLGLPMVEPTEGVRRLLGLPREAKSERLVLVVHDGAHDEFRRWNSDKWSDLIRRALFETDLEIVLVGGPGDRSRHENLVTIDSNRVRSVAGQSSWSDLSRILDNSAAFVGNDSGPAHLAAAVGIPTFVVSCFPFGGHPGHPNSPARFAARSVGGWEVYQPTPESNTRSRLDLSRIDSVGVDAVWGGVRHAIESSRS